jgi:hypothetical protein
LLLTATAENCALDGSEMLFTHAWHCARAGVGERNAAANSGLTRAIYESDFDKNGLRLLS